MAVGLGTDGGFPMKIGGFVEHRELQLMQEGGLNGAKALRAALGNNKRLFGALTEVMPGQPASFFLVEGDPRAHIRRTTMIRAVWLNGTILRTTFGDAGPAKSE